MTFSNDLERGKFGEQLFEFYCSKKGIVLKDTRSNPDYQIMDIDYIADGVNCEVKTDYGYNITGNLAVEHKIKYLDGRTCKGGLHTTKADYIVYAIPPREQSDINNRGTLFIINIEDLRYITSEHYNRTKICDDSYKTTECFLVNPDSYNYLFEKIEVGEF